ncbi:nucleoside deaminase [Ferruginibacter yonginensis]|uniref:Nucleoside deaminase n=1 Tax=Ferruginibacter yonginensis TaxID=1310416 RepID=A0ABV8QXB5_9BACT
MRYTYFRSMNSKEKFMMAAVELSKKAIDNNEGGPFGCVIVKNGEIVGSGYNKVTSTNDPTAHAEVVAIRDACKNLQSFQLDDCEVYTSCEPCPMCLGAIYWARPKAIYYANSRKDAAAAGFDDSMLYDEIAKDYDERKIPIMQISNEKALAIFEEWNMMEHKKQY